MGLLDGLLVKRATSKPRTECNGMSSSCTGISIYICCDVAALTSRFASVFSRAYLSYC